MTLNEFAFSEKVSVDRFEEGSLIVDDVAGVVICLGKFETEILDLLLAKGRIETINILKQQYNNNDRIGSDIDEFCANLISQNIIIKQ